MADIFGWDWRSFKYISFPGLHTGDHLHIVQLEMLQEILGEITPQSLRTFIHSRNPSAYELEQVLQFFGDLILSVARSGLTLLAKFYPLLQMPAFKILKSCIDRAVLQIFLEKLFVHFLASAIVIFFLFEYLMGYIERGGWATYSDTSWEFRATYVPVELRLAFYFLFHFRAWPAQPPSADGHILGTPNLSTPAESSVRGRKRRAAKGEPSVYHRIRTNKFEPKLKAPRTGEGNSTDIWLGDYPSHPEAANVYWIGAYYYDRHDRLSNSVISWCRDNLPDINRQANLSTDEEKALWIREQAKRFRFDLPHPSSVFVEHRGGGSDIRVISGEGEGGSQTPMDPSQPAPSAEPIPFSSSTQVFLAESPTLSMIIATVNSNFEGELRPELPPTDFTGADQGHHFEDLSTDDWVEGQFQGDQGSGSHQQGVQHLQQNCGRVTNLEDSGAGAEVGAVLQQGESEVHHVVTEQYLATGCGVPVISGTAEAGSLPPINGILASWPPSCGDTEFMLQIPMNPHQSDCTGIGLEQVIIVDVSVDDYEVSILPEVGAMSRGETGEHTEPRTFANHMQVMDLPIVAQELQEQNLEDSGAGAEVGAVLQQDESEVQHVLRASANHPQAVDLVSQESKELKCTDAIQSGLDDLIEQHWDFEIQRRISTETFSIPYPSLCEGSKLTRASYLAFREIYKQGFKVTLIPLNNDASVQDGNGRPQSRTQIASEVEWWRSQSESSSRDVCRSCNARLYPE